jgi:hypothetical protein
MYEAESFSMTVFWDAALCSPVNFKQLHGAASQKTVIFILTRHRENVKSRLESISL